jgi:hypothetical protein
MKPVHCRVWFSPEGKLYETRLRDDVVATVRHGKQIDPSRVDLGAVWLIPEFLLVASVLEAIWVENSEILTIQQRNLIKEYDYDSVVHQFKPLPGEHSSEYATLCPSNARIQCVILSKDSITALIAMLGACAGTWQTAGLVSDVLGSAKICRRSTQYNRRGLLRFLYGIHQFQGREYWLDSNTGALYYFKNDKDVQMRLAPCQDYMDTIPSLLALNRKTI